MVDVIGCIYVVIVPETIANEGGHAMTLVDEARRLAPDLAASNAEADQSRRLPDSVWKTMHEAGLFRALQPARWGGGEVHLREFFDAVIEVSRSSGSAGWVMGVIGVHPWQLALFPERAQQQMWGADPGRMHSSSYSPSGKAIKVDGGYRLSGRWSFSSGSDHCSAVNVGVMAGRRDMGAGVELPDFRSMVVFEGDYEIVDTWHTAGLKGTGSNDIVIDDVFVPDHLSQSHLDYLLDAPLPGWDVNTGPLYRAPWAVVFNFALAASVYGTALGYLDTWLAQSVGRSGPFGARVVDDALMQRRVAEFVWDLDAVIAKLHRDCDLVMDTAASGVFMAQTRRVELRWNVTRGCEIVGRAVNELHHAASGRSIFSDHPLQRGYQDVQGALGHAFLVGDAISLSVGAARLGGAPVPVMA
jgi:3-hydroxy-9,10-secoandrosta-1,3,5(10)-triene-9,17-dione monooxygenase